MNWGCRKDSPFPLQVVREKYKSFYARKKKQSAERAYIMEKQKKIWNKIIGENIRRLRISHNETQAELEKSSRLILFTCGEGQNMLQCKTDIKIVAGDQHNSIDLL